MMNKGAEVCYMPTLGNGSFVNAEAEEDKIKEGHHYSIIHQGA